MDKTALLSLIFALVSILPAIAVGYALLCRLLAAESRINAVEIKKILIDTISDEQNKIMKDIASLEAKLGGLNESLTTLNNKINARTRAEAIADKRKKESGTEEGDGDGQDIYINEQGKRIHAQQQNLFPVLPAPAQEQALDCRRRHFGELKQA